ncbi:uncharacterized protein LOC134847868, partial [Symsagittifera roscoffensis]|uniref:uncharacterized protein LOC134847868 n=1 Tax=Symsagittifera roscoffensis TaxID=84072 RepID=UPI00307C61B5
MSSGEQSNSNASVLLPIVQPADIKEFTQGVFFFQELNPKARHSFHPARAKKTTIPVNTVSPHPKFLAYFNKTEIGRRKGLDSLTPNELAQVSSNLPIDLQQELLNDDDGGESDEFRNSQKFKFEQCKQAAFNLLMKVAFTLDTFDEDEQTVTEELESLLAENLDQLSANTAYEKREWQTQAYKDEAAAVERESVDMHTPSVFQAPSTSESAKMATSPLNPQGTLRTPVPPLNSKKPFGNAFQANKSRAPSLVPVQQMATIVNDAVSLAGSENQDTLGPLPTANSMSKIKSAFRGSSRQRTTSGSDESETGSRRSRMSTRSGNRSGHLAGHSTPPVLRRLRANEQIVTVCFSLESKECEEKGWIVHSAADSSAEDKRYTAVLIYKMIHASGEKIRDQDFIEEKEGRGDNGVQIDYWGNKKMNLRNQKQPKAVDLHGGDTRLLPWPIMPETTLSQAFPGYISLPDGTQCINYRTGQLAVLFDKLMPNASSFFCTIFSEEGNLQALIHPGCRGSITLPSSSGPSLIYNSKGGTLYNSRGDRDRVFTWPIFANRLPEPITLTLNDKMTIRVLNSNQIFLYFNYGVEKYKINLTKTVKGDPSFQKERGEMSIYLLSDLKFISKTARELESPKKKSAKSSQVKSPTKRGPSHSSAEMGGRGT